MGEVDRDARLWNYLSGDRSELLAEDTLEGREREATAQRLNRFRENTLAWIEAPAKAARGSGLQSVLTVEEAVKSRQQVADFAAFMRDRVARDPLLARIVSAYEAGVDPARVADHLGLDADRHMLARHQLAWWLDEYLSRIPLKD